jgi:O-antigen ligase
MAGPTVGEVTDSRLARWGVTADLIKKSPVIGYGAGSEIGLLQNGFYNDKLYDSYLNRLNTHSEYLSITLKSGIIGLSIYLTTLIFGFKRSIRQRDILFFTFMMLISIVSISENLLDVDKGIIFYAFFFSFFTFLNESKDEKPATGKKHVATSSPEPAVLV